MVPFSCADKSAEKHCWLICCERKTFSLFVSLVYCAESTVRWFVAREKHCWMAADSADKSKRTERLFRLKKTS
jgi:hypothetical protein